MILLAALLCNYGRGKCLIIIGTDVALGLFERGSRPASAASAFSAAIMVIFRRVSTLAEPMCGASTALGHCSGAG